MWLFNSCLPDPRLRKRVIFLGLNNSGKTTLFNILLAHFPPSSYVPTKQPFVESANLHGQRLVLWDIPGSEPQTWRHFYTGTDAVIFVIDSQDEARLETAREQLKTVGHCEELKNAAFLIVFTKERPNMVSNVQRAFDDLQEYFNDFANNTRWIKSCTSKDFKEEFKSLCGQI